MEQFKEFSDQIELKELQLNALLEVTQAINNNLPESSLYKIYQFTVLANLRIEKFALFAFDQSWECKLNYGIEEDLNINQLSGEILNIKEIQKISISIPGFRYFDTIFPIRHKNRLLAVVFLDASKNNWLDDEFSKTSMTFIQALTNILIVAIENKKLARKEIEQEATRKELQIASQVQKYLFPKELPKGQGFSVEASYLPNKVVGGDYYDFVPLSEDKYMLCIADVSGKGMPAALMMSNFQASLRTLLRKTNDLKEIVEELNYRVYDSSAGEIFITFFISIYDKTAETLSYINCGHNQALVFRKEREPMLLETGTTILGVFDPLPFMNLEKIGGMKEFLFFSYTDGLVETFNKGKEQYGLERLIELIASYDISKPLSSLHEYISKELSLFRDTEEVEDDITMLSFKTY